MAKFYSKQETSEILGINIYKLNYWSASGKIRYVLQNKSPVNRARVKRYTEREVQRVKNLMEQEKNK